MSENFPKFISNIPIGEDQFEGKSQDRVADYIATNLSSNDNCQILGIDGGWGSGKSNLIEIIRKKLNNRFESKYHFFIYDAWGHQEDLQRRSFLEELTFFLTKSENDKVVIKNSEKWNAKLKQLLAKSKETQKKSIPSLSIGIVFSGLVLILTPLFKSISEVVECSWLKIIITAIPFLFLTGVFVYYYVNKTDKNTQRKNRINQAIHKLFYIYQQTQKEDITIETVSEDEPSVKKFRDWMKAISEDLDENRLVIVFDNMDRLPDQKITELSETINNVYAQISYFITYGDLLVKLKTSNSELVKLVAAKLTTNPLPDRKLLLVPVLKSFDSINDDLKLPDDSLIKRLNDWSNQNIPQKGIEEVIKNIQLLKISSKFNYIVTKKIIDGVNEYLESLSQDIWKKEFANSDSYIVKAGLVTLPKQFPGQAVSASKEILLDIAKEDLPIPDQSIWKEILNKSHANSVKAGIKDVRDLFLSAKEININLFQFFADWLLNLVSLVKILHLFAEFSEK